MNYKKKWQGILLKKLHEQETVETSTRNATEIGYISELQDAGKIKAELTASGVWTCRLKESTIGVNT